MLCAWRLCWHNLLRETPLFWGGMRSTIMLDCQEKNGPCFKMMFRALIQGGAVPFSESGGKDADSIPEMIKEAGWHLFRAGAIGTRLVLRPGRLVWVGVLSGAPSPPFPICVKPFFLSSCTRFPSGTPKSHKNCTKSPRCLVFLEIAKPVSFLSPPEVKGTDGP